VSSIIDLVEVLPEISQSRLVAAGYGVWVVWKGDLNPTVENTLQEFGCLCISRESHQALWFCNTGEVFRALARLQVWARVNPMDVFCEVIPLTFLVGYDLQYSVSLAMELERQDVRASGDFEVVIHPKLKGEVQSIVGLGTEPAGSVDGAAGEEWQSLVADQGLDYETHLKWYFIIKPLGHTADKESILGWRDFSTNIIELLQRLGLKYISDVKEGVIFFPLDSFRLLRSFCTEIMSLIRTLKDDGENEYWPTVMVAVQQGGYQFTPELPKKIGLDWGRMTPDYPHVKFMEGFLLSDWFRMNEVRYGTKQVSLDSWCTLALKDGGEDVGYGSMQVALPSAMIADEGRECFYCGLKNHAPKDCPSKKIAKPQPQVWHLLAGTDVQDFSEGFDGLDEALDLENFSESIMGVMSARNDLKSLMARAVFEINATGQLRTLRLVWRSRGKEWVDGFKQLAPAEGDFIWDALSDIERYRMPEAEILIQEAQLKYPRSYQPHSLLGFWHLEQGDANQALFHWQEAERMSYTPLQKAYFSYLQARLKEVEGSLKEAINAYQQTNSLSPTWLQPVYRQAVCMVKMGFTGQAIDLFFDLIGRDPHFFNYMLVDPELDRGRVQLMNSLWEKWTEAEETAASMKAGVEELTTDISKRFDSLHSYYDTANDELERLRRLGDTQNYVAYQLLIRGTEKFRAALDTEVKREIKRMTSTLDYLTERVRDIQKEAGWFPFPKLLLEFNKEFNACVDKINWVKTQPLHEAENFRKAMQFVIEIEDHIDSLQSRLVTLRIIRDSTLFILMLGRNFIWLELIGLGLLLVGIPSLIYFTQDIKGNYILDMVNDEKQRWEIAKGLVIILSIVCVAAAAVKSALTFEKRKKQLFDQLDKEMRKGAPKRY